MDGSRDASIEEKRFNAHAPLEYFLLLKQFTDLVKTYDEMFGFPHSQLKSFYDAMIAMLKTAET